MNNKDELVYWGAGTIGKMCLEQYPNIRPHFFIDSNRGSDTINDIPIKRPDDIEYWDKIFIVITMTAPDDIEAILKSKNLKKNENYALYRDFFPISKITLMESLSVVSNFVENNQFYKRAILIMAPVFISRESNNMICFFKQYGIERFPQRCVLFSHLGVVNEEEARKLAGYPVFNLPEICKWEGVLKANDTIDRNSLIHEEFLSRDEKDWILQLEERKVSQDQEFSYKVTIEIYWYFKKLLSILKPSKVLVWGGWSRESYILADVAERAGVPYGFMEHGWIPGTIQFDKGGISGQSEYAVNPSKILERSIKSADREIKRIRNYIIVNKTDTGKFRRIEEDEINLQRIDKRKKTVFFVGMGDYSMGINPHSDYWKQYVSSIFPSTKEAVFFVAKICEKNDWNFIYKPHPNPSNQDELDPETLHHNIIQVKYVEIDRLIRLADVVVSIASAVDYKVLIYGKPLVQLGHTTLYKKGCSYEVSDKDMVEVQINVAMDKGMTMEQNEKFELHMARLLEHYLWDDLSDRELRYGLSLKKDFFEIDNQ